MSACPQCGTAARPTDKFCNACGTPIARASMPAGPAPGASAYGAPNPLPYGQPAGTPGYVPGQAPPAICPLGHEIVPGASYCAQGHPIALDPMQFSGGAYPGGGGGFGAPPPPAGAYGAPTPLPPVPGFDMPPGLQGSFPPAQAGFGAPPGAIYGRNEPPQQQPVPPTALRGFLVAFGNNPSGDFWPLAGGRLTIGRFGSADRIDIGLQSPTLSSRHAAMLVDAASGTITIEDTGSTNGTFVNDEHIGFNGRRDLRDGDRLRFGAYTTIVKVIGRV